MIYLTLFLLGSLLLTTLCCCCVCACALYAECFKSLGSWTIISGDWIVDSSTASPTYAGSFYATENAELELTGIGSSSPSGGIAISIKPGTGTGTLAYIYFAYIDSSNWSRVKFEVNVSGNTKISIQFSVAGSVSTIYDNVASTVSSSSFINIAICYSTEEVLINKCLV